MYRCVSLFIGLTMLIAVITPAAAGPPAQNEPETINLTVTLEWQPGDTTLARSFAAFGCPAPAAALDESYLANLQAAFRRTAAYLYAFTEGQFTLGNVEIFTGGENLAEADIFMLASSSYRPTAFVGGIVDTPTVRNTRDGRPVLHYPAPVLLGRLWDGSGARCGAWADPAGWRTIGHELGHFALFLYDQYFNLETGAEQYCTSSGLRFDTVFDDLGSGNDTLMAYHYSADDLWRGGDPPADDVRTLNCSGTPQDFVYAGSEWDALRILYPDFSPTPNPALDDATLADILPLLPTSVSLMSTPISGDTTAALRLARLPFERAVGEAYLLRYTPNNSLERIIGQGLIVAGEADPLPMLGAQPGDRVVVFADDAAGGKRYAGPLSTTPGASLDPEPEVSITANESRWRPSITIIPNLVETTPISPDLSLSEINALTVELRDCNARSKTIELSYCPAGGLCDAPVEVRADDSGLFRRTFSGIPAVHGYFYARSLDNDEETVVWYQIGGGVGPAHGGAHAPLADGLLNTELPPSSPAPEADARVLHSPTVACTAPEATLPPGVAGIIGTPLNLQPVIAGPNTSIGWGGQQADLRVRLSYNQDLLDRLNIDESDLLVLRRNANNAWQAVPIIDQSTALDWIAAAPQSFSGTGEDYVLAYRGPRVWLPVVVRN